MELSAARAWLDHHADLFDALANVPSGRTPRRMAPAPLSRMEALIELLGSPQLQYPAIHITGTNGKTSTARMTTALLVAAGLSVGTDTSPYLQRLNERMSLERRAHLRRGPRPDPGPARRRRAPPRRPPELHGDHQRGRLRVVRRHRRRRGRDRGGARRDAGTPPTSSTARVAVVTNVEHRPRGVPRPDHAGHRRRRRPGSSKPGAILVLGETEPELVPIFTERGPERVVTRGVDFGVSANALALGGRLVDLFTPYASYPELFVPLHGAHQADNAAAALAAAECFLERPLGSMSWPSVRVGQLARVGSKSSATTRSSCIDGTQERRRRAARARRARRGVPAAERTLGRRRAAPEGRARDARRARCRASSTR